MQFIGQSFQVVRGTEACIELSRVGNPITVVGISVSTTRSLVVLADGTDPNYGEGLERLRGKPVQLTGCEPSVLDIVQVLTDRVPVTTTPCLVSGVALRGVGAFWKSETVDNDPLKEGKRIRHGI